MGECDGVRGVWGYVRGGMGALSNAIAAAARERGAEIEVNAPVSRILVEDGRAAGVVLANGDEVRAAQRGVGPRRPAHVPAPDGPRGPARRLRRVGDGTSITPARAARSTWRCRRRRTSPACRDAASGPQHHGTIHICPDRTYIETRLRLRQVRLHLGASGDRGDDAERARRHGRAARPARDVDVHAVLSLHTRAGRRHARGQQAALRRALHRHHDRTTRPTSADRCSTTRCWRRRISSRPSA